MLTSPDVTNSPPQSPSRRRLWIFLCAALALARPAFAAAAAYPERPVSIIVPFAVGTATDSIIRQLTEGLHEKFGVPFIVQNLPGASGIIGTDRAARAAPDGYTLVAASGTTMSQNPWFFKTIPYNPASFEPIARIGGFPLAVVVRRQAPWHTMAELLDAARTSPRPLSYGTAYGMQTVCGELLKKAAGADLISVSYKGTPQEMTDLLSGQINLMCAEFATGLNVIRNGQARALAILTKQRSHYLPDVPTMGELKIPFPEMHSWIGVLAPHGTPAEIVNSISQATLAITTRPEFSRKLESIGFESAVLDASGFSKFLVQDRKTWGILIKQAGIAPQ